MLPQILLSALIVSLISLIGVFFISKKLHSETKFLFVIIAFAAGAMMGDAFFHILPESVEQLTPITFSLIFLTGFIAFFIIEKLIHWRHCHDEECHSHDTKIKPVGYMSLIGDGIHNFLDGILIAVSYLASFPVGLATTIAVIAHEIPQEIGDFSVLIHSGFSKRRALVMNFLSACIAILGALIGYFFLNTANLISYTLPLVAGSLVYIAATDLIPELHQETKPLRSLAVLIALILGLATMYFMKMILG